jgi:hypothetical protein
MQQHILLRYANAGLELGALAERAHRYDVAKAAYEHTIGIYPVPVAEAGRERCEKALAGRRHPMSVLPWPRRAMRQQVLRAELRNESRSPRSALQSANSTLEP